jgi:hypothetical protein
LAIDSRPLRRSVLIAFTLLLIVGAILVSAATRLTPYVRDRAIAGLNQRLRSQVALDSLQVSTFPRPEVIGGGLALRHNGRTDVTCGREAGAAALPPARRWFEAADQNHRTARQA